MSAEDLRVVDVSREHQVQVLANTGCLEKSFSVVFLVLLCGECYENVYT
jgi:hypothetical protein